LWKFHFFQNYRGPFGDIVTFRDIGTFGDFGTFGDIGKFGDMENFFVQKMTSYFQFNFIRSFKIDSNTVHPLSNF
jgi:hypothetical protein